ncbi:hypothetical protein C8R44DRAFT_673623 [Mycena epipterygia]|nr:hypothetical protein C8R44DRAFT_673623 [Mycena epipterygia]
MRLTYTFLAAVLLHTAASSALIARVTPSPNPETCVQYEKYVGIYDNTLDYSPACASVVRLTFACLKANGTSIWSHAACVAAATCQGTTSVVTLNQCQNPSVLAASSIPNLSGAIWSSIVGSCSATGCPMTQQNYIDFIYGSMSAAGVTEWPSSVNDVISQWWDPIVKWTATGETVPYSNFNDWLHWSNS